MCNIAGYAGSRQAAPILLEMLRRQEYYDGNMSTGVVTIHEGTLYYRKMVGTVEELTQKSDVLELPGTIGIAHTRPSGAAGGIPRQPHISEDETAALVTNGIYLKTPYLHLADEAVKMLVDKGYHFQYTFPNSFKSPKLPKSGVHIFPLEVRLKLIDMHVREGKTYPQALALTSSHIYADNAMATISENAPDSIFALRTTRPLLALEEPGETYLATCRYAFADGKGDLANYLPLHHSCEITREGLRVCEDKIDGEPVSEITDEVFHQGYERLCAMLRVSKENAYYFDDLEFAALEMRDIFPGDHTLIPHAQLVYDVLWQLDKEGRLCKELRTQDFKGNTRKRWYMWLED